jgi:preprotein translocase subunit SecG
LNDRRPLRGLNGNDNRRAVVVVVAVAVAVAVAVVVVVEARRADGRSAQGETLGNQQEHKHIISRFRRDPRAKPWKIGESANILYVDVAANPGLRPGLNDRRPLRGLNSNDNRRAVVVVVAVAVAVAVAVVVVVEARRADGRSAQGEALGTPQAHTYYTSTPPRPQPRTQACGLG